MWSWRATRLRIAARRSRPGKTIFRDTDHRGGSFSRAAGMRLREPPLRVLAVRENVRGAGQRSFYEKPSEPAAEPVVGMAAEGKAESFPKIESRDRVIRPEKIVSVNGDKDMRMLQREPRIRGIHRVPHFDVAAEDFAVKAAAQFQHGLDAEWRGRESAVGMRRGENRDVVTAPREFLRELESISLDATFLRRELG